MKFIYVRTRFFRCVFCFMRLKTPKLFLKKSHLRERIDHPSFVVQKIVFLGGEKKLGPRWWFQIFCYFHPDP